MEKLNNLGLKQATRALCGMSYQDRLEFIAQGLPILLESAQGCWKASCVLALSDGGWEWGREALMLQGHASEEAAKALILLDAVRCPEKLIGSKIGKLCRWWYSHLARLIYANAVSWRVNDVRELIDAVDSHRKAYHCDYLSEAYPDDMSEKYIIQNHDVYWRESILYADVERSVGGEFVWSDPSHTGQVQMLVSKHFYKPGPLLLIEAMNAVGIFTLPGTRAVAEIWGKKDFTDDSVSRDDNAALIRQILDKNIADDEEIGRYLSVSGQNPDDVLYKLWQLPMYNLDLSEIK